MEYHEYGNLIHVAIVIRNIFCFFLGSVRESLYSFFLSFFYFFLTLSVDKIPYCSINRQK